MAKNNQTEKEKRNGVEHDAWIVRGVDSVYFQREAQVAWWTILGGIAVAALLTEVDSVFLAVRSQRWQMILFLIAAALIILTAWVQLSWASLILKLPISIPVALLFFVQGILLSLLSLNVANPPIFTLFVVLYLIWGFLSQVYLKNSGAWVGFSQAVKTRVNVSLIIYIAFTILAIGGFINLNWFPSNLAEIIWGFVALMSSIVGMLNQHIAMSLEKKELGIP